MEVRYRILEHPADLGIEAWGENVGKAFENAVLALISTIVNAESIESREHRSLRISADDYEGLLVRLLSEVLYLFDGERFLTARASITGVTPTALEGQLSGEEFNEEKHKPVRDIKAITYHQISVREHQDGVHVRVYLDI